MNVYDQVRYGNRPYTQTHPSRLFVIGRLAGLDPPPVETCRVLELGASEGANLIAMAVVLPEASFTGIDLAGEPVALGRQAIAAIGLSNVALLHMDLLETEDLGEFDYIIAHGLYAWTPAPVRDRILEIAGRCLSPRGLAFVSYNTYPAGHIRRMAREMMLYHARAGADPAGKLAKAREMLRWLAEERQEPDVFHVALSAHAQDLLTREDSVLFHDDLGDIYEPVYFHEFASHAARHGLAYAGDAAALDATRGLKPEVAAAARALAGGDAMDEEQYLDMLRMRRFRQSVLCRAALGVPWNPAREPRAQLLAGCYAASSVEETPEGAFVGPSGIRMTTTHPAPVEYLRRLIVKWPAAEPIAEGDAALALELFKAGMLELQAFPGVARAAGERPCASALARYQAGRGESTVATLWHHAVRIEDDESRRALALLDGTRDRTEIAREMQCTPEFVDEALAALGRSALLIG